MDGAIEWGGTSCLSLICAHSQLNSSMNYVGQLKNTANLYGDALLMVPVLSRSREFSLVLDGTGTGTGKNWSRK